MKNVFLLIPFIFFNCNVPEKNYYPVKLDSVSDTLYAQNKHLIDYSYKNRDLFMVGMASAMLGENPEKVFKILNEAIIEDPVRCCGLIHLQNHTYQHQDRSKTISAIDTLDSLKANELWETCKVLMDSTDYMYRNNELSERYNRKNIKFEKSTVDKALVKQLELIYLKDRAYRGLIGDSNKVDKKRKRLQKKLDKENLLDLEKILEVEFPSKKEIGDLCRIPYLVLHHCSDIKIKEKYLPFLEAQVLKGDFNGSYLKAYKYRMELL